MKKLLLLVGVALGMAACSDSTTAPSPRLEPSEQPSLDITCRSGYIVAYNENGEAYCKPEER